MTFPFQSRRSNPGIRVAVADGSAALLIMPDVFFRGGSARQIVIFATACRVNVAR
jgi:hypothetical protein